MSYVPEVRPSCRRFFIIEILFTAILAVGCGGSSADFAGSEGLNESGRAFAFGASAGANPVASGGPVGPVGAGSGTPVGFGIGGSPNNPGQPTTSVIAVIYAAVGGSITSLGVAPDGSLSVLARNLATQGNITEVFLGADGGTLYGTDYRGNQIFTYRIDSASASLTQVGPGVSAGTFPSDLAFFGNKVFAYASNANAAGSFGTNTVTSFLVGPDGQLSPNPASPAVGTDGIPSNISINQAGTKLYAGSRDGATINVYSIGSQGELTEDPPPLSPLSTQGRSLESVVSTDGRFLFLTLLSNSPTPVVGQLATYAIANDGSLTFVASLPWNQGTSPQGLIEHPTLPILYVVGDDVLVTYAIAADGTLSPLAGTTPLPAQGGDSLLIDPTSKFLYAPGFFAGGITSFRLDPGTGAPTPLAFFTGLGGAATSAIVPGPNLPTP